MALTEQWAQALGCSEVALRLVLGQLSGYPLFLLHHYFLKTTPAHVQHWFFALTGVAVAFWAVESALVHGCVSILITWAVLKSCQGSPASTLFLFFFHLLYLFIGYMVVATEAYDINWTVPQCVMCLRLIGLSLDLHDGKRAQLSHRSPESDPGDSGRPQTDQNDQALTEVPSLLHMFSHCFFIGGYFVGPQFSMKKFQDYVHRNIHQRLPSSIRFGFVRLACGIGYLIGHLIGSRYIPEDFPESAEFASMDSYVKKSVLFSLWCKIVLAKYISMWLMAEGAVILSGLAYSGHAAHHGRPQWVGGANVKLRIFESSSCFQHLIDSFNINTNAWVMKYVYKRLKFLNQRVLSQAAALLFLAMWHGYHSGYYLTFFQEFLVINFEKQWFSMVARSSRFTFLLRSDQLAVRMARWSFGKLYVLFFLPHCFLPFGLLKHRRYLPVMWNTNCMVFLFFGTWPVWRHLAKWMLKPLPHPDNKKGHHPHQQH